MKREKSVFTILVVLAVLTVLLSFLIGRYSVNPFTAAKIVVSRIIFFLSRGRYSLLRTWTGAEEVVVMNIRLPRIIAAFMIGGALSLSGASYQAIFRNPMVSPDLLGASSGAGFGAAVALLLGGSYFTVTLSSFAFGLLAVFLALLFSRISPMSQTLSFVLAGMMVSSLFSSATSFVKLIADTDSTLPAITYWLMGSLSSVKAADVKFALVPILLGSVSVVLLRWRMNILSLSECEARSLGVNTSLLRIIIILSSTLMTASCVAISGMIGWVGLVIPHFARLLTGVDNTKVIPSSVLLGGTFLLFVDNLARIISAGELPLGILTSFIGAPVFIYLIVTGGREYEA